MALLGLWAGGWYVAMGVRRVWEEDVSKIVPAGPRDSLFSCVPDIRLPQYRIREQLPCPGVLCAQIHSVLQYVYSSTSSRKRAILLTMSGRRCISNPFRFLAGSLVPHFSVLPFHHLGVKIPVPLPSGLHLFFHATKIMRVPLSGPPISLWSPPAIRLSPLCSRWCPSEFGNRWR